MLETGRAGGAIAPPTFAENRAKLFNYRQFLVEFWFLTPHFWVLTPHFSVASEGPSLSIQVQLNIFTIQGERTLKIVWNQKCVFHIFLKIIKKLL